MITLSPDPKLFVADIISEPFYRESMVRENIWVFKNNIGLNIDLIPDIRSFHKNRQPTLDFFKFLPKYSNFYYNL